MEAWDCYAALYEPDSLLNVTNFVGRNPRRIVGDIEKAAFFERRTNIQVNHLGG